MEDVALRNKTRRLRWFISALLTPLVLLVCLLGYWYFRPNTANIHPNLVFEYWPLVADGQHNSNTDMIHWQDAFWMIHASSPWHFGSEACKLVLWRSEDAKTWERITEIKGPGTDIRDPTFAPINGRLYLYVMLNSGTMATPFSTTVLSSADGREWTEMREVDPKGWLLWRPKSRDGKTWYCPAYWHEHGKSILLKTEDGETWTKVSDIYEGDGNDETAIEFLPDGRMICTARLEITPDSVTGHPDAHTLISVADPPYTEWKQERSYVTRLDGPRLFEYDGEIYAVARYNPQPNRWPTYMASTLGKKRTSLFKVEPDGLIHLSDLPSAGDTSYAGVVIDGDTMYACYYTSRVDRDWPWIIGMLSPSDIVMAGIDLPGLAALTKEVE